jgi:hypothetical protein
MLSHDKRNMLFIFKWNMSITTLVGFENINKAAFIINRACGLGVRVGVGGTIGDDLGP